MRVIFTLTMTAVVLGIIFLTLARLEVYLPGYNHMTLIEDLQEIHHANTDNVRISTIGHSEEGRSIPSLVVGEGTYKLLVVAGTHAREWLTSQLVVELTRAYLKKREFVENTELHVVPMLNPDGIEIASQTFLWPWHGWAVWRANNFILNSRRWKANAHGIDLNMQFGRDWETTASKSKPSYMGYKGAYVEQASEAQAIASYIREIVPDALITYHSSGSVIYWYYGQDEEMTAQHRGYAQGIGSLTGYRLIPPEKCETPAAGLKDWFVMAFGKPGLTIEIGNIVDGLPLPPQMLPYYIRENKDVFRYLLEKIGPDK